MIVAALGFTECVPFARALDQIRYSKPVMSTPICTAIPRAAYAGGDLPKWTYGLVQTLVNMPGPQSKLYLKKGLQYGTTVPDMLWVFSEGRLGNAARDREDHEPDPVRAAHPGADQRRVQGLPRPARFWRPPDVACGRVSAGRACCVRQPDQFYNYMGSGKWKVAATWLKPPRVTRRRPEGAASRAAVGPAVARDRLSQMRDILLFAALGLGAGALVASIALGVVLVYRGSGVINMAMGAIAMSARTSTGRSGPDSSASSSRPCLRSC